MFLKYPEYLMYVLLSLCPKIVWRKSINFKNDVKEGNFLVWTPSLKMSSFYSFQNSETCAFTNERGNDLNVIKSIPSKPKKIIYISMTLIEHFSYLLGFSLVWALILVINAREIRHNDGDGKGDDQDSGQGANATDHFAYCRAGHHVTIPEILIKIE